VGDILFPPVTEVLPNLGMEHAAFSAWDNKSNLKFY